MKRLLTYLFLVLGLLVNTIVLAEEKKMVASGMKMSIPVITYSTPDSNFPKLLSWNPMTYIDEDVGHWIP